MGFYLDENCEETMVDSFSEQSYYISHDVGVRVSMHRGGFPFPHPFLEAYRPYLISLQADGP